MKTAKRRFFILLFFLILLTGIMSFIFWPFIKQLREPEYREWFSVRVAGLGFKGALILFGLQILQIAVAVIPGGPLEIIAGAAYGAWKALLILEAGCAVATLLISFAVKKFGKPLLIRFFGAGVIDRWDFLKSEKKTALVTFVLFLIPGIPKDTLTYLVPLTTLSPLRFTLLSVFARFPAMLSAAMMGDAAFQGNWFVFFLIFAVTAFAGILGIQMRDRVIKRFGAKG